MKYPLSLTVLIALAGTLPASAQVKTLGIGNVKRYVSDLTRTADLYQNVFGLEFQTKPSDYAPNENGQKASGTTGSVFRFCFFRLPGLALQLEPVEYKGLDGHPLPERKRSDIGDQVLILTVKDLDTPVSAAKKAGLRIVTAGGVPRTIRTASGTSRAITFRDYDGHPIELRQPTPMTVVDPAITGNVIAAAVEISVEDLDKTYRLFHDSLGLEMSAPSTWSRDAEVMEEIGVESKKDHPSVRSSTVSFDGKPNGLSFVEFRGIERTKQTFRPLDAGGNSMSYAVNDLLEAIRLIREAGGETMGASPIMNPNGGGTAFVRTPNATLMEMAQRAPGAGKKQ